MPKKTTIGKKCSPLQMCNDIINHGLIADRLAKEALLDFRAREFLVDAYKNGNKRAIKIVNEYLS